jgi:hypothetical protein
MTQACSSAPQSLRRATACFIDPTLAIAEYMIPYFIRDLLDPQMQCRACISPPIIISYIHLYCPFLFVAFKRLDHAISLTFGSRSTDAMREITYTQYHWALG